MRTALLLLFLLVGSLGSCGLMPPGYNVSADVGNLSNGIGSEGPKKFSLVSLESSEPTDRMEPLVEQRMHNSLRTILAEQGWVETEEDVADVIVAGFASISAPQSVPYTYSVPTWGQTGVSSSYTTGYVNSYGNYSATTTYTPQYGITGYRTGAGVATVYTRRMNVAFINADNPESGWRANIVSTGSSGDLRKVIPAMAIAMGRVFLENPGESVDISVSAFARESFVSRVDALAQERLENQSIE